MRAITSILYVLVCLLMTARAQAAGTFSTDELLTGFEKTVFGLEYRAWSWQPYTVKKYTTPVRFSVHNLAQTDRRPVVNGFIREINRKIRGLNARMASSPGEANFEVFVVDRHQYADVIRRDIYRDAKADAPGRCLVRVVSGKDGIKRSSAVIVSDEGEFLFRRCLVEEVLQGLGPMNDDKALTHSVFNDTSRHSRFTVFDQVLLNMLYDARVKPGMSFQQIQTILPIVARDALKRVR